MIHPSLELLEPGSASRHALRDPISRSVLQYPLDSLAAWCPFLHVLHVVETDQVLSANGVEAVLGRLPLERATLGYQKPTVPVEAVESGMKASRGRLDLVEIHVGYVEVVHRYLPWSCRTSSLTLCLGPDQNALVRTGARRTAGGRRPDRRPRQRRSIQALASRRSVSLLCDVLNAVDCFPSRTRFPQLSSACRSTV